jgi:hypothetical protein
MILPDEIGALRNAVIAMITAHELAVTRSIANEPNWQAELTHLRGWAIGANERALPALTDAQHARLAMLEAMASRVGYIERTARDLRGVANDAPANILRTMPGQLEGQFKC